MLRSIGKQSGESVESVGKKKRKAAVELRCDVPLDTKHIISQTFTLARQSVGLLYR